MAKKKASAKRSVAKSSVAKKKAKRTAVAKKQATKKTTKRATRIGNNDFESARTKLQSLLETPESEKQIVKLLMSLDESQRRELFPVCENNYREVSKTSLIKEPSGTFRQNPLVSPAQVAMFCTANFKETKKLHGRPTAKNRELVLEVLEGRKPSWVGQYVEYLLAESNFGYWKLCRGLVRRELCPKPTDPRYYTGIITGLLGRWNDDNSSVLDELKNDPGLLKDEIWRLFEYEGEGDNTLARVDCFRWSDWAGALSKLSEEGKLPRARLLDSALGALELEFNHYRSRWFFDFFDRLQPTDQEIKKRATRILDLMASQTPNVAQWAFEKQQRLIDSGMLKATSQIIHASTPLLGGRHKKTVMQVLKLFDQLAKKSPKSAKEICLASVEALGHEKADLQRAAFKLIDNYGSPKDGELYDSVERYVSVTAATVKKQLNAWLASAGSGATESKTKEKKKSASKATIKPSEVKRFDARHVNLLSLKPLVDSLKAPGASTPIPAAVFDGTEIPRLTAESLITPINDLDELLETLGRVIEDDSLVDDAERAIDGLARLHADKPDDFDKLVAPLYKRVAKLTKRKWLAFSAQGVAGDLCGLICAWKRGEPVTTEVKRNEYGNMRIYIYGIADQPSERWHLEGVPLAFMSQRMLEVCEFLTAGKPIQLLSTPTHQGGWVDAQTLVARINASTITPPETDVILAMLRVAPDGRSAALKKLKPKLKGEWINAIKHGLGASGIRVGKSSALWAAAARCRSPLQDDPKVVKAFPKLGPGAGKAARFEAKFWQEETKYGKAQNIKISTTEKLPKKVAANVPTQMLQQNRDDETSVSFHDIGTTPGSIQWLAMMWPAAHETFFATGATCLGENLDWWEAAWHNRCFLEPLLDSDVPLLDMGAILLLCGLGAKEPGEHGLAADITIQAINDGRVGTDSLATILTTAVTSGHFNLSRLTKRLQDIAGVSELHAYVVMSSVETSLAAIDVKQLPRGTGDLVELLLEFGVQMGRGIESPECRSFLESMTGSNKAAKAAKQLLAVETQGFDAEGVLLLAIENRISRLEEWAKRE